ncbi:hypothetical protein BK128_09595 [Viridibacillus sp. FSL H7-0596]|uniref:dUTP diphosphatase n=1 Tax=Viridibacillus sp. FSL H7-0596 TaxID=1928923 RepID=UPI00096C239B|nr:dUTP diphosphatase [Viridibacillus sp. FSL H7-0596]OMC86909.1 hypothetical protein BK128_09595 [Viridibacillus sp. FSL H7-0596]
MNLTKLFEAQKELDLYIEQQHPVLPGEDRLSKKILALLVELGECANEWRGFKFWSNDQIAREFVPNPKDVCEKCKGLGMLDMEKEFTERRFCNECDGCGAHFHNPLVEEYVDCLHFILSIGNEIVGEIDDEEIGDILLNAKEEPGDIIGTFIVLCSNTVVLGFGNYYDYRDLLTIFLSLGYALGFTPEQIEQAYWEKYEINKQRQQNGY